MPVVPNPTRGRKATRLHSGNQAKSRLIWQHLRSALCGVLNLLRIRKLEAVVDARAWEYVALFLAPPSSTSPGEYAMGVPTNSICCSEGSPARDTPSGKS